MAESNAAQLLGAITGRRDRLASERLLGALNSQPVGTTAEMLANPDFIELSERFPQQAQQFGNRREAIRQSLKVQDEASERAFFEDMRNVRIRLENRDLTGARAILLRRRARLNQIPGAETDDVDRILNRLENEDFQGALNDLAMADQIAVETGILPALSRGEGFTLSEGQRRFDASGNEIASNIVAATETPFTLSPGQTRFDETGAEVASLPSEEPAKKITSAQRLAAGFGKRTRDAGNVITELGPQFTGFVSRFVGSVPQGRRSPARQQFDQATRDFINATLRRESGAAIAPSEFENANLQYIPQPGDSEAVLDQKRRNRETISQSLILEAEGAFEELEGLDNTVIILGTPMQVGQIVENAQGQRGRVEADGSITLID